AGLGIRTRDGASPRAKLAIHHSHFWNRMAQFIRAGSSHLARHLGKADFEAVIRAYVVKRPPTGLGAPDVPASMAGFLATTSPWCESPVLAHLARYDRQWAIINGGAEDVALGLDELEAADRVRLIKRAGLITTWYRFQALDVARLARGAPPDATPTYL